MCDAAHSRAPYGLLVIHHRSLVARVSSLGTYTQRKMRQLAVTVPIDREGLVLEILQDECGLKNLTRRTDGITTTFFGYVSAQVRRVPSPSSLERRYLLSIRSTCTACIIVHLCRDPQRRVYEAG
jgi:hypothetical protein